ncbi:MAG: TlpA family protein disulfide reductase [Flavobacteriaceae bacterium]|nr:TlpA family protein disulfide reductase [Flavobacteriaceae bacterium]
MKLKKSQRSNLIFLVVIALLIIPQTRQPIQVLLNKGFALFGPSVIDSKDRIVLDTYNWQLEDIEGHTFDYASTQNKVVLINFWATWCPPCIAEMPSLEKLQNDYKDKVVFLFVSNEDEDKIFRFMSKNKYSFKVHKAKSEYPKVFDVSSIPRTFLIDKKGNIVIDKTGASNWNSEKVRTIIDQLLIE